MSRARASTAGIARTLYNRRLGVCREPPDRRQAPRRDAACPRPPPLPPPPSSNKLGQCPAITTTLTLAQKKILPLYSYSNNNNNVLHAYITLVRGTVAVQRAYRTTRHCTRSFQHGHDGWWVCGWMQDGCGTTIFRMSKRSGP